MSKAIITKKSVKIAVQTTIYTNTSVAAIKEWNDLRNLPCSVSINALVRPEFLSTQEIMSIDSLTANSIKMNSRASFMRLFDPRRVNVR